MTLPPPGGGERWHTETGCHSSLTASSPSPTTAGRIRGAAAVGAPRTLCGRPHGDPFPLPHLGKVSPADAGALAASAGLRRRGNAAIDTLNMLDAPTRSLQPLFSVLRPNAAQASVHQRLVRRIAAFGPAPAQDGDESLFTLLRAKDIYSARSSPVAAYRPELFRVLDSGIVPKPLRPLLPPHARHLIDFPEQFIYRSQSVT